MRTTKVSMKLISVIIIVFIVALLIYLSLSGGVSYYYQLAIGNYKIMRAREPIDEALLAGGTLTEEHARLLRIALDVRRFASEHLSLPENDSYRVFSNINREFVGWNVYETEAYSVEPKTWCFPITGCIVYRGFFDLEGAKSFVAKEKTKKNDLFVGPITAYSTLGTFNDPILSSHLSLPDFRLASLIIHELAHQKLYFSGKSEVNEAFAVVVERAGLVKWLNATGREEWLPRVRAAWDEEDRKVGLILNARNQLKTVYANGADDASKAADKTRILHDLEAALCETSCSGDGLPKASSRTFSLNNAYMTPVYTYYGKYDELKAVLDEVGGDLDKFYGEVERRYR